MLIFDDTGDLPGVPLTHDGLAHLFGFNPPDGLGCDCVLGTLGLWLDASPAGPGAPPRAPSWDHPAYFTAGCDQPVDAPPPAPVALRVEPVVLFLCARCGLIFFARAARGSLTAKAAGLCLAPRPRRPRP